MSNTSRTPQQALQDALNSGAVAAFIAGKSIDMGYSPPDDPHWVANNKMHRPDFCRPDRLWRPTPLSFPTPPEGCIYHNPHDLTPEQVGEGYRLLLVSEIWERRISQKCIQQFLNSYWGSGHNYGASNGCTYRVPKDTPFHWDTPKRIPLAPEDFIGSTLRLAPGHFVMVVAAKGNNLETYPTEVGVGRSIFTIDFLTKSDTILVRLANTTEFVNCYKEEAV